MFDWLHQIPILSIVCYLPLAGALVVILFFKKDDAGKVRRFATWVALLDFLISLPMWWAFQRDGDLFQFRESAAWIDAIGVRYEFGVDGIALHQHTKSIADKIKGRPGTIYCRIPDDLVT